MWNGPTYDCQQCGACCVNPSFLGGTAYVFLTREETKRMKSLGLSVVQVSGRSHLGTRAPSSGAGPAVCVAFQGGVGGRCGCAIYPGRPAACRRFQVGSPECQEARGEAGLSR
jgi:Fe-S-cluster containining protein